MIAAGGELTCFNLVKGVGWKENVEGKKQVKEAWQV